MGIILTIILLIMAAVLVRNNLVFTIRVRRLTEIIDLPQRDWVLAYNDFESLKYNSMMLDLRKWTYNQFYPDK